MIAESEFHERVLGDFRDALPESWVRSEVYLPSDRTADVVIDVGGPDAEPEIGFAIELEDKPEQCIGGAGQAIEYAGELGPGYAPVVAYPATESEPSLGAELDALARYVPVLEL